MTDPKSWLWRKKSSDKTVIVAQKDDLASKELEKEIQELLAEKVHLEADVRELDEKLSSALSECAAKDDLVKKHAKTAKDALAGWEKAEAKSLSLKQELDEAVKQREVCEERARHLDSALKECMQQLRFVREDKEQRIHDVLLKAAEELEETKTFFEEKLEESGENIAKLSVENSQLGKMLSLKDDVIDDLTQQMTKAEAHINALLARLETVEKENKSLRYEVRVLEKEVDIRNEEKEFNRRTADSTQKQHLENVKKIAKLESECQRLRVLVRKRLPGPAALAKMKTEVGMLNKRKSSLNVSQSDYGVESYLESPEKKINLLSDRVFALEDENNLLRETLEKHLKELQISRTMYVQTATKLSQVEAKLDEFPKRHLIRDLSHELSLASMSDSSYAGSTASPCKSVAISDINHFMDDFAEMEKLALVCIDKTSEIDINSSECTGKELVPVSEVVDSKRPLSSRLSGLISKLIEIIVGINLPPEDHDSRQKSTSYLVRVFQWKSSELADILRNFVGTCEELLNGNADFETFAQELTNTLEWIISHCFSLQDVSVMKETIKKQIGWDETRSESEIELKNQFEVLESRVTSLQVELEEMKRLKTVIEEEVESNVMMIENLNVQLLAVKCEMHEAHQKFAALEAEIMSKTKQCEELEGKCLDLQAQLESVTKTNTCQHPDHDKKKLETEMEISAASEKLAECQETILHLGKQLKALTTSRNNNAANSTTNVQKLTSQQRSSLFDQMQADDDSGLDQPDQSPETKEIISAKECISATNNNNCVHEALAIVPFKKQQKMTTSGGLFKKLLWRKKKSSHKRIQLPFSA
ncbi:hypothetical protein RND81_11G217200 [Saponaria officinalis]|uniref:Filament-like plant protein 7 n=1 Tax=Saponaria officinalis TaxID=3572 RepID=A0AAW1HRG6_SAPOF